jgi:hypothetical protein
LVARKRILKGEFFKMENIKPVLVYENTGLKSNEFYHVNNKRVKKI